jgi:glyoxalase-like protein
MNLRLIAIFVLLIGVITAIDSRSQSQRGAFLPQIDHIVYGTPDLQVGIQAIERLLGVRATPGGQHPGLGTHNALVALGPNTYLEILAPDPDQPKPSEPLRFGLSALTMPRLVAWAAKGNDLDKLVGDGLKHGVKIGRVIPGSRQTPQGSLLTWRVTDQRVVIADGIGPFFIDWGQTPHPARTAAPGATLVELRAEHPDPISVRDILSKLGLNLPVAKGTRPALVAVIDSPRGRVELR